MSHTLFKATTKDLFGVEIVSGTFFVCADGWKLNHGILKFCGDVGVVAAMENENEKS